MGKLDSASMLAKSSRRLPRLARLSRAAGTDVGRLRREPKMTDEYIGLTGAQIFTKVIQQHNVKHIFGYPGGAILPVFDAIYGVKDLDFILARHEQGAGHMAEGYARASGGLGVALVTSGPGATNLVTPLQDALMDGCPLVCFTGQVATTAVGSDAFQEADILGITRPATKWNVQVRHVTELPRRINEAFAVATSGRPGPVLVDLPKDIMAAVCTEQLCGEIQIPYEQKPVQVVDSDIEKAVQMLATAKRPVIYAGQGVLTSQCWDELRAFAKKTQIPVTTTLLGMGAFDERDPLSLHMLGMHGSAYANYAVQSADVILCIGARFDDRVTGRLDGFAPAAKNAAAVGSGGIIHLEISPKQVGKLVHPHVSIVGDAKDSLNLLNKRLMPKTAQDRADWLGKIKTWKAERPFTFTPNKPGELMKPQAVVAELYEQTKHRDDVVIATGVGQHQMFAAQHYRWHQPHSIITSGGLGTMGFGVPAAIGAKVAVPHKTVIDIDGDASFSMTAMEMATAAEYGINAKWLVLNNECQGMVKQWQDLFYAERHMATKMTNPDFVKLAEAMHCKGMRCSEAELLSGAMEEFLASNDTPVLLECVVDKDEHCYPMVAAGAALDEMVFENPLDGRGLVPSADRRLASISAP